MGDQDLIERCCESEYCPFEDMLTEEQRRISVLEKDIPEPHIDTKTVEQICGRENDRHCNMKEAVKRINSDDRHAIQYACVGLYRRHLNRGDGGNITFPEAFEEWNKWKNLGGESDERCTERFGELWPLGLRKGKQIISAFEFYETCVAKHDLYKMGIRLHKGLLNEFNYRHENGIKH